MEDLINEQIFEQIFEKWEIISCTNGVGEWELGIIYQSQKAMDYIIEEDN